MLEDESKADPEKYNKWYVRKLAPWSSEMVAGSKK